VHLHKYYLEKNQVPRELAIISLSLACLRLNKTHMLEAENKSHNVYPSWDGPTPSVVCFLKKTPNAGSLKVVCSLG
jgi:hypothetical protein